MKTQVLLKSIQHKVQLAYITRCLLVIGLTGVLFSLPNGRKDYCLAEMPPELEPTHALSQPAEPEIIKIKVYELDRTAEWIRIEVIGNQVKPLHTRVVESGISKLLGGILPMPIAHTWHDHPTSRVVFQPDRCGQGGTSSTQSSCLIVGTDTITLPTDLSLDQGQFTLEYTESDFLKSITFRVPSKPSPTPQALSRPQSQSMGSVLPIPISPPMHLIATHPNPRAMIEVGQDGSASQPQQK
jgi:hypothetical protein